MEEIVEWRGGRRAEWSLEVDEPRAEPRAEPWFEVDEG